ncbi:MAG: phosphoglycolate phosphatase [Pseudomonadota bacterium]
MAAIDLDGTLVDSVPDLSWAGDEMLRQLGLEPRGEATARLYVGNGLERFVKRLFTNTMQGEPDENLLAEALPLYREIYAENTCRLSTVYPGVTEGLDYLRACEVKLACITNKAGVFTESLLQQIGLIDFFDLIVSGDSTPKRKPHPLPLQHAAQVLNVPASRSLMIGDSKNDVLAAIAAGFRIICVPYGYNHGEDIRKTRPDAVIESMAELPSLFST